MVDNVHPGAGSEVVIEDFLRGRELSVFALCDYSGCCKLFPASEDRKEFNGQNSGGVFSLAPVPGVSSELMERIRREVITRVLAALYAEGIPFAGCLYAGLMVGENGEIWVLEFNARFGDPEITAYLPLIKTDLFLLLKGCVDERLSAVNLEWCPGHSVSLVLSSAGYPSAKEYRQTNISGIEEAEKISSINIFYGNTVRGENGEIQSNGGRVIYVNATGKTPEIAYQKADVAAKLIHFEGMQRLEKAVISALLKGLKV